MLRGAGYARERALAARAEVHSHFGEEAPLFRTRPLESIALAPSPSLNPVVVTSAILASLKSNKETKKV